MQSKNLLDAFVYHAPRLLSAERNSLTSQLSVWMQALETTPSRVNSTRINSRIKSICYAQGNASFVFFFPTPSRVSYLHPSSACLCIFFNQTAVRDQPRQAPSSIRLAEIFKISNRVLTNVFMLIAIAICFEGKVNQLFVAQDLSLIHIVLVCDSFSFLLRLTIIIFN